MICEKCWSDAYLRSLGTGKTQYACYLELLDECKDTLCPPEAQSNSVQADAEELKVMLLHLVGKDRPHNYYHEVCSTCEKIRKFEQTNRSR